MFLNICLKFSVTLCRWSAKQTIPLSVLARKQTKGLGTRDLAVIRKWVRKREKRVGQRDWKKAVGEG